MAYDREQVVQQIIAAIKKNKLTRFSHVWPYVAASKSSLYDWELEKLDSIKKELEDNAVRAKVSMRNNWIKSENATLQLAAYKLMAEDDELERLTVNNNNNKHTGDLSVTWNETRNYEPHDKTD